MLKYQLECLKRGRLYKRTYSSQYHFILKSLSPFNRTNIDTLRFEVYDVTGRCTLWTFPFKKPTVSIVNILHLCYTYVSCQSGAAWPGAPPHHVRCAVGLFPYFVPKKTSKCAYSYHIHFIKWHISTNS